MVERRTENPCVGGSIPFLGTTFVILCKARVPLSRYGFALFLSLQAQGRGMKNLRQLVPIRFLTLSFLIIGAALRLRLYLENRSFWLDEAWLALDISLRSIKDILSTKILAPDMPVVPMGFSLVERFSILFLGNHEYALRLFPLVCGFASLYLLRRLVQYQLTRPGQAFALFLLAFSGSLIRYAAELKQYSTALTVVLALYLFYFHFKSRRQKDHFLIWCLAGMLVIFFSHVAVFVLAAIALVQIVAMLRGQDWSALRQHAIIYIFWLICLGCFQWPSVRIMLSDPTIQEGASANNYFPAYPLGSPMTLIWFWQALKDFITGFLGLWPFEVALALFIFGGIGIFKKDKDAFYILIVPFLLSLAAALLHKYPFGHRFLMFAVPLVLIFIAKGIEGFWQDSSKIFRWCGWGLAALLVLGTASNGRIYWRGAYSVGDYRDVIRYLSAQTRPGDELYLNHSAKYLYGYYIKYDSPAAELTPVVKLTDRLVRKDGQAYLLRQFVWYDYSHPRIVISAKKFGEVEKIDVTAQHVFGDNPRTWFLFAHFDPEMKEFVLSLADREGERVSEYQRKGAELYLYDFAH